MSTQSRGGIPLSEQIEIYKYKIKGDNDEYLDPRYHHVSEHLDSEFQELVNSLGKQWELRMDLTYHTDEEEYETKPEDQDNVYHPLDEIDSKELGDILDPIEIYYFRVKNSQDQEKLRFYVPSSGLDSFKKHIQEQGYTLVAQFGSNPFSIKRYREFCENPPPNIIAIPIGEYDDLASEFERELTKRNINKENLTMTPATLTKPNTEAPEMAFDQERLMEYLMNCSREFLDELILTFDKDALETYQYALTTKRKRDEMYKLMCKEQDMTKYTLIQNYSNHVTKSAESIKEAKQEYQKVMKEYKGGLRAKINDIGVECDITEKMRDQQKQILGKQKRSKIIEKGLKGFGRAVVVSYVDGQQEQVVAAANYIAVEASKIASNQNLEDAKSLEGTKNLIKNASSRVNNLVATLHTENGEFNALANRLAAETKPLRDNVKNKVEEVVKQSVVG